MGAGNPVRPKQPKKNDEVEEKLLVETSQDSEANLHNVENNASPTLEAAKTIKEEVKTPEKPPTKVNPERIFTNKPETKSHTSKHYLTAVESANLHDEPVKSSTDSVEKPFTDGKSEKLDSDDNLKPHDLKPSSQQRKCDTLPTKKSKPHVHGGDPINNKLGIHIANRHCIIQ